MTSSISLDDERIENGIGEKEKIPVKNNEDESIIQEYVFLIVIQINIIILVNATRLPSKLSDVIFDSITK